MQIKDIIAGVKQGSITKHDAIELIHEQQTSKLDFATIDYDRLSRRGIPETIFCPGKSLDQISGIFHAMKSNNHNIMATRASEELFSNLRKEHPATLYHPDAKIITLDSVPLPKQQGEIAIVSAGTADIPVAAEASLTASRMGAHVTPYYDVGVAGLHRLLNVIDDINKANVVIIVAGMEGALPSVAAGLINKPVIAVPTSIGYGLNMDGLTALLAMLNSCAAGITVVNIDNGFGAGVAAAMINRQISR